MPLGKDTEWLKEDLLFPVGHFVPFISGPCRCIIYSKSKWMHFINKIKMTFVIYYLLVYLLTLYYFLINI